MIWLNAIFNKVWVYILLAVFVAGFLWKVYQAGGDKEKLDQLERKFDLVVKRNRVEDEVDRLNDDAVTRQLRERGWLRDR